MFDTPTWVGTGFILAGIILLLLPLLLLGWFRQPASRTLWSAGLAFALLLLGGFLVALLLSAPSGDPGPGSPVQQRFTGDGSFRRYTLTNLIPESEQVNLGFPTMPYLDPLLTRAQAQRALAPTLDLYQEMEADDDFRELGATIGLAYNGLLGRSLDAGHYYLYVPQQTGPGPLPVLIFLHGAAGNFKAYTWLLSRLAEEMGFALIVPSYGFGTWDEEGVASVLRALADARQVVNIDPERIYLAGLSNGGIGVSTLAAARPELFRGLIFISPALPADIVGGEDFQDGWIEQRVLVVTGAADRRIPLSYVEERVEHMRAGGVDVEAITFPHADHFLIFTHAEQLRSEVSAWLRQEGPGGWPRR